VFTFNLACTKEHPSAAYVGSVQGCSTYLSLCFPSACRGEPMNPDPKARANFMNINEVM